ncbi:MAG: hypothetical protein CVU09_00395 [Bacteroidetes bacterium HGW-Bacteroidetes-4]|jgi:hypothetical protein|nr:MAG: hypothetical protein CVU09_00395 [Bacteroidetes bacterium HGW-Bacteroidetes-4]
MELIVKDNPQVILPDDYYKHSAMSNSDLGLLEAKTQDFDPTEAYAFGNLVDHLITEPEKVDVYRNSCNGHIFTNEQMQQAIKMKAAFMLDPLAKLMVDNADCQQIMHKWVHHKIGNIEFTLDARCKWDLWMSKFGWGGDIKTTTAETQEQFEAACRHFKYPRQRFFYMTLAGSEKDVLIGISKKNYKVFKITIRKGDAFWNEGRENYEKLVVEYWKLYGNE